MREIKFKAWDKTWKRFDGDITLPLDRMSKNIDSDRFELVQFTGLKDKSGKDIFEGDILKITRVNWYCPGHPNNDTDLIDQVEVYWDEEKNTMSVRTFDFERLEINPNQRPYSSSGSLGDGWNDERADENIWEIVGNIYENPELLKKYAFEKEGDKDEE